MIIYGAGKYGKVFYTYCELKNKAEEVEFFVVSKDKEQDTVFGKSVYLYRDINEKLTDKTVWIAVAGKSAREIEDTLHDDGIVDTHILTSDLFKNVLNEIFLYFNELSIQNNKVFMDCYEGLGYRCNCKYIAEELQKQDRRPEIVWNLSDTAVDDVPEDIVKVTRYSYEYFREAYTSKVYISNDGIESCIYKRSGQFYICTWHGSGPFKKINLDLYPKNIELSSEIKNRYRKVNLFTSSSRFNTHLIRKAFGFEGEVLECGTPRMDCLLQENDFRKKVCSYYNIDLKKKIVLYAPTFRNGDIGSFDKYDLKMDKVLEALETRFQEPFILLYRFHHRLYNYDRGRNFYKDAVNTTLYSDVQELLGAADVLISDYSSVMWDFSLQRKPVFLYHNDLEEYMKDRGFYSAVEEWPYIKASTSENLCSQILTYKEEIYLSKLQCFFEKYGALDNGKACEQLTVRIVKEMWE